MRDAPLDVSPESLAALAMRQLHPGVVVDGRFVLRDLIGQGGMGLALRAWEPEWERDCVLKLLSPHMHARFRPDPDCAEMLRREAKTLVRLANNDSSAFVQVYGRGDVTLALDDASGGGQIELPYYAMELLRGSTFQRIIRQKRRGGPGASFGGWYMVFTLAHKMAAGLAVAHSLGIVHRDLKPDNIYLHKLLHRWEVKIIDWGISTLEGQPRRVGTGTDRYAAPELVQRTGTGAHGEQESTKSDIYPLGLVMYELATGRGPFEVGKGQFARAHVSQPPPLLSEFRPDAPRAYVAIVDQMLAKDPAKRPTAADVVAALEDLLRETPNEALDTQIEELLPASHQRAARAAPATTQAMASSHPAASRAQSAISSLRSETFAPAARPPSLPRLLATLPLAGGPAATPNKYADTLPEREPFGAELESGSVTAPLGQSAGDVPCPPVSQPAHLRVFSTTGEMFDFWEDDTRYASSPLLETPEVETPGAADVSPSPPSSPVAAPATPAVDTSPGSPVARTVISQARRSSIAARVVAGAVVLSAGILLTGVTMRVRKGSAASDAPPPYPAIPVAAAVPVPPSAPAPTSPLDALVDAGPSPSATLEVDARAPEPARPSKPRTVATLPARHAPVPAASDAVDDLNREISH